ncbi:hypothetical protein [Spirosoma endophyticum]|uniref:Uncharacterized protein n=1 Tax=Spirosoma endophyticum TaxID=662367 RepID=A0A1I2F6Q0_9BACT|nr:hypothetical protein [Spirosoma endophyticum]SFF00683.1 hypothetical protein SAMN05216167_12476 [Spirosoma endophyticum]
MKPMPSFSNLLEQYIFAVAERVIDRVDSQTQTRLINLIHQVDTDASASTTVCSPAGLEQSEQLQPQALYDKPNFITPQPPHQVATRRIRRIHQQQRVTLAQLARQLVQVSANLAQTQAKLEEKIGQNKILLARCRASAKL